MRIQALLFATALLLVFSGCAGGDNVSEDTPADLQMTVSELRNFDEDKRPDDMGKVGEVTGIVMSSKRAASNEKEMGSHFIQIYTEKTGDEKFDPQICCYTWGNPGVREGNVVRLKGNVGRSACMGQGLRNCHVERIK